MERITFQEKPYSDERIKEMLHPLFKEWFFKEFKEFSPPQRFALVNIHQRENTLISSPTGSGKTLAAFGAVLNELIGLSEKGLLEERVYAVYVSPLKALSRDIERNLLEPLKGMEALAGRKLGIRIGVRTGDTSPSQRAAMLKKPPHILITTPESLAIMLTTKKFVEYLKKVEWVVVDEVHSIAGNKRGVHLSLSLERLERHASFARIGLSATISPLEEVAKFLVGFEDPDKQIPRPCKIVDVQYLKKLDLKVLSPVKNLIASPFEEVHGATYKLIDDLVQSHKTTLIFTNTRSATERVVHHLKERFPKHYAELGEEGGGSYIGAHHGSLSKELRVSIEEKLKEGKLKAVVSSTSLELGIDIGYIDLVILLGSPKSVARALQRIGRSGHKLHETAKGRIIVLDRDDLVECSVLLKSALEKKIDRVDIPRNCLDVLAQQVFGVALEGPISVEELYALVRRSYNYATLSMEDFKAVLEYLSGAYSKLEDRNVYAKIWLDNGVVKSRGKMARVIYMTNVGTIPDETHVKVKVKDQVIGFIAEPFLERLRKGDVFVLGGETYEFLYTRGMTAYVKASVDRPPTVPSWYSEMLPLSYELALDIQRFRRYMEELLLEGRGKEEVMDFIHSYLYVDEYGANSVYEYFKEQFEFLEIPHDKKLLVEHYSEGERRQVIFHSLYGRRVNDVLSRALGYALSKMTGRDVEIGVSDNGFYLASSKPLQVSRALNALKSEELRRVMSLALEQTEVLRRRFRHCAARALMILREYKGRTKSVGKQQMSSRLLLGAVKRISKDFPILKEAKREVLEDFMDVKHAEEVLERINNGAIEVKEVFTTIPSPFAFNLVALGLSDIMKMEDKAEFLKRMHNMVLAKIALKKARQR